MDDGEAQERGVVYWLTRASAIDWPFQTTLLSIIHSQLWFVLAVVVDDNLWTRPG